MAQSTEFPDLVFVRPRWWHQGRDGWAHVPRVNVVHHTAGAEGSTSAEDGAHYDTYRQDTVSSHFYHDRNSSVQCVLTWDMAYGCYPTGNHLGIQHELCGTLQSREQWLDPASDATLTQAAAVMARCSAKYLIPARRLTSTQLRGGEYGFAGHGDITEAFGEGDHTDPGPGFPWDVLLARVQQRLIGEDRMHALIKLSDDVRVYRTDGIVRFHIPGGGLPATRALGGLVDDGAIRTVESLDPYGVDVTDLADALKVLGSQLAAYTSSVGAMHTAIQTVLQTLVDRDPGQVQVVGVQEAAGEIADRLSAAMFPLQLVAAPAAEQGDTPQP